MRLPRSLFTRSFDVFRSCGQGRRECVVFWTGPLDEANSVDEIVHPRHRSGVGGYEIEPDWLPQFWLDLYKRRRALRVQVHTHPGAAYHSSVDDDFPAVHTAGFLSLVIPDFACAEQTLERVALFERDERGVWIPREPLRTLELAA
jgi:hypothetical protein